jgi:hypothetical protein
MEVRKQLKEAEERRLEEETSRKAALADHHELRRQLEEAEARRMQVTLAPMLAPMLTAGEAAGDRAAVIAEEVVGHTAKQMVVGDATEDNAEGTTDTQVGE